MANTPKQPPQFPAMRGDLAATKHWQQSLQTQQQRLYVQLCMVTAAARDYFLAQEELQRQSMNWSATMSYYSIMHACRSILFQCFGDIPTRHADMAMLMAFDDPDSSKERVRLGWLGESLQVKVSGEPLREAGCVGSARNILSQYACGDLASTPLHQRLIEYGPLVSLSKDLREDGNYEALLIAHEHVHDLVERSAALLSSCLGNAAGLFLDLARDVLVAALDKDPYYDNPSNADQRGVFKSFASTFLRTHLEIAGSVAISPELAEGLRAWRDTAKIGDPTSFQGEVSKMWDDLQYSVFTAKNTLMQDYKQRVDDLNAKVQRITQGQQRQQGAGLSPQVQP